MKDKLVLRTGCRIHFGLFPCIDSSGNQHQQQCFGGLGASLRSPGFEIEFSAANELELKGNLTAPTLRKRVLRVIRQLGECGLLGREFSSQIDAIPVRIDCHSRIAPHRGLGSGTQIDLAIAKGLLTILEIEENSIANLATILHRGTRSRVGTIAFQDGGLVSDMGGRQETDTTSIRRVNIPNHWRVALFVPRYKVGLSGVREVEQFRELDCSDMERSETMSSLATGTIVPACAMQNFTEFATAVEEFGRLAGTFFEACQGGTYHGAMVAQLVDLLKQRGARGVGQSSWGPTVFAWFENENAARKLVTAFISRMESSVDTAIVCPNNEGAKFWALSRELKEI
ncbi:MAG TPA: hypothetical protein PKD64_10955 [Pirellulaceae bacterium]|nr:hypothetical protein [Pirellulaceae bacterium]HMO92701.1 hypothetical protein [Pirellulaceae bacterium]HMP70378.1 hypothetical protein [Pirellulaceae bacterium]